MKPTEKKTFILYTEYQNLIKNLTDENKGKLFEQILLFASSGEDYLQSDGTEQGMRLLICWELIRERLIADTNKYNESRLNDVLGGVVSVLKQGKKLSEETKRKVLVLSNDFDVYAYLLKKQGIDKDVLEQNGITPNS